MNKLYTAALRERAKRSFCAALGARTLGRGFSAALGAWTLGRGFSAALGARTLRRSFCAVLALVAAGAVYTAVGSPEAYGTDAGVPGASAAHSQSAAHREAMAVPPATGRVVAAVYETAEAPPVGETSGAPATAPIQPNAAENAPGERPAPAVTDLDGQVARWIAEISAQPEFASWRGAGWETFPLGPGTHGWIVIVSKDGHEMGYLVIHALPDGDFQLGEYGVGDRPLFSVRTLRQTLARHGLIRSFSPDSLTDGSAPDIVFPTDNISSDEPLVSADNSSSTALPPAERLYFDALHALWRVDIDGDIYYFEAKTGELYPLDDESAGTGNREETVPSPPGQPTNSIVASKAMPVFDPFERVNWLTRKPVQIDDEQQFDRMMHHEGQVTYTAQLFQRKILAAFAVIGYHKWNDDAMYVAIDHVGVRYMPYSLLVAQGHFYQ